MLASATHFLSSIVDIILAFLIKKILIPTQNQKPQKKLSSNLWELMIVCQQNLYHTQELQKQAHNKVVEPQSYAQGNKVWLSSKLFKTTQNCKLEAKFFGLFQVLHLVGKQVYKLKLPKKWRIHDIFHVFFLGQNITKKE